MWNCNRWVPRSQVQSECLAHINHFLPQLHYVPWSLLDKVPLYYRHQNRFNEIDFLHYQNLTKPYCQLQWVHEFGILLSQSLDSSKTFKILLQPCCRLSMRVNDDRNRLCQLQDLTVLYRKLVIWKPFDNLLQNCCLVCHKSKEIEKVSFEYFLPLVNLLHSDVLRALSQICHKASCHNCVSGHHLNLNLQFIAVLFPTHLFIFQFLQKFLSAW